MQEEGLGAWRQERECKRENNQEGDLLYLFPPFLSLNRNAVLIKGGSIIFESSDMSDDCFFCSQPNLVVIMNRICQKFVGAGSV